MAPPMVSHRTPPSAHTLVAQSGPRPVVEPVAWTAVVGCVDVLERTGDSLTISWKAPIGVGQNASQFHLEVAPNPTSGCIEGQAEPSPSPSPSPDADDADAWGATPVEMPQRVHVDGGFTVPNTRQPVVYADPLTGREAVARPPPPPPPPRPQWASTWAPGNCSSDAWSWREVASGMHRVHLVGGLEPCTPYAIRLRVDHYGASKWGPAAEGSTLCPPNHMPPVRLACSTADGALLEWDAAAGGADAPATHYRLFSRASDAAEAQLLADAPDRRYWLRGLRPGDMRLLSVAAFSPAAGESAQSSASLLVVPAANPFRAPAQRPPVTLTSFGLQWVAPPRCSSRPVTYKVFRQGPLHSTAPLRQEEVLSCRGAATACEVAGLPAGSDHHLQVFAYERGELVHASDVATVTTLPTRPGQPHPPRLLNASDTELRVAWLPPEHDRGAVVQSYQLTLAAATEAGVTWQDLDEAPGACRGHPELRVPRAVGWHCANEGAEPPTVLQGYKIVYNGTEEDFTAAGLKPAATYYVRVRAVNRMGASAWSHAATLRTRAGAPLGVEGLRQTGFYTRSARVAWERVASRGEPLAGYQLQAKPLAVTGGGEGLDSPAFAAAVRAAAANASWTTKYFGAETSFEVEGLPPNGVTLMRARARSPAGDGAWSRALEAHTRAEAFPRPRPLLAHLAGRAVAKLSWEPPVKTAAIAPMLYYRVRCSLLSAPRYSPPPSPPPAPAPSSPLPSPPPEPTPTPTPQPTAAAMPHRALPDIRFDAGWFVPSAAGPPAAAAGAPALRRAQEAAEGGGRAAGDFLPLPPASQGRVVYTGAETHATVGGLLPGAAYACAVTAVNLVGESEYSKPTYFTMPHPTGWTADPPAPPPSVAPADAPAGATDAPTDTPADALAPGAPTPNPSPSPSPAPLAAIESGVALREAEEQQHRHLAAERSWPWDDRLKLLPRDSKTGWAGTPSGFDAAPPQ